MNRDRQALGSQRALQLKRRERQLRLVKRNKVEAPNWVYEVFMRLNAELFAGQLPRPTLKVGRPGKRWRSTSVFRPSLALIVISPDELSRGAQAVEASLLHEMVHQSLWVKTGRSEHEHGERFVAEANRIAKHLRWPLVTIHSERLEDWPRPV